MRNFTLNSSAFLMLIVGLSCGLEKVEPARTGQVINAAVDIKADAEFTPGDDDLKCFHDGECEVADQGCCYHEKLMAINRDRYPAARAKIRAQCKVLSHDFYEQQVEAENQARKEAGKAGKRVPRFEKFFCKAGGRDAGVGSSLLKRAECKKELPRLQLRDRAKDPKKYDDDEKAYNAAAGKCTLIN